MPAPMLYDDNPNIKKIKKKTLPGGGEGGGRRRGKGSEIVNKPASSSGSSFAEGRFKLAKNQFRSGHLL